MLEKTTDKGNNKQNTQNEDKQVELQNQETKKMINKDTIKKMVIPDLHYYLSSYLCCILLVTQCVSDLIRYIRGQ